jgi:hypothetical protein
LYWIEGTQRPIIVMKFCSGGGLSVIVWEKQTNKHISIYFSFSQLFKLTHTHTKSHINSLGIAFFFSHICVIDILIYWYW